MVNSAHQQLEPLAKQALECSPIQALRDLKVDQTQSGLLISGSVSCFYHKQLAQEAIRSVVGGTPILNSVRVKYDILAPGNRTPPVHPRETALTS